MGLLNHWVIADFLSDLGLCGLRQSTGRKKALLGQTLQQSLMDEFICFSREGKKGGKGLL